MRQIWSAAVLLVSVFLADGLYAQSIPSPFRHIESKYSVGLFGGYLQTDRGELNAGPASLPLFGIRFDMQITGPMSVIAAVSGGRSDRTVYVRPTPTSPDLNPLGEADVGILLAEGGFNFRLTGPRTWHGLAPFFGVTAGVVDDFASISAFEVDLTEDQIFDFGPGFAAAGSLGTDIFLLEKLSIRAEARDQLWRYTYPSGLSGTEVRESEWVHNVGVSVGATIHF